MVTGLTRGVRPFVHGLWLAALASCSTESVTVDLQFQTLDYFLISDHVEILAFKQEGSTRCPELAMRARTRTLNEDPDGSSGDHPTCEFRDGGVGLSLDAGEYDLLGVAKNRANFVVVVGCTHAYIDEGASDVTIPIGILSSEGRAALKPSNPILSCTSVAARCAGDCD